MNAIVFHKEFFEAVVVENAGVELQQFSDVPAVLLQALRVAAHGMQFESDQTWHAWHSQCRVADCKQLAAFEQFLEWTSHLPRPVSLLIDGSFVSNKALPNDIDLVVDITGCMPAAQAQWVEAWNGGFAHAKAAYNVDFYPFVVGAGNDFSAFFQYVRIEDALRRGISPATRKGLLKVSG